LTSNLPQSKFILSILFILSKNPLVMASPEIASTQIPHCTSGRKPQYADSLARVRLFGRDKRKTKSWCRHARMKERIRSQNQKRALRWARRLHARTEKILSAHPSADPDNIRHTLILLEQPPLERLQRSLIRGRAALFRK
jgi:hypothetical protein